VTIPKDFKYPRNKLEYFFKGGLKAGGVGRPLEKLETQEEK